MSQATSILLSDELAARLDELAASLDRPRAWLIEQAISRYVEEEARHADAIAEALAEYRSGKARLTPHAEVMDVLREQIRARVGDADFLA